MKVKLGFFLYLKVIKKRSIGGEDTHLYSERNMIQTGRESQTKNLAGKTKERAAGSPSFVHSQRRVLRFSWDLPNDYVEYYNPRVWVNLQ